MNIDKKFKITICSDQEYKELIAEVYFLENIVAIIDQEDGFNNLRISIFPNKIENWNFLFLEFMEALEYAKKRLWELRKIEN